ncbi:MAG: hypothetical protein E7409_02985 [Ruminococcaceae bacterium]|nr:hypothetical protein [Oscillospiraceae bacterium]
MIFVPNYYHHFHCIAQKCKHNCCIGWEIDIDHDTLQYYQSLESEFGARIRQNITQGESAHFILKEGEKCPFLNQAGLCEIICTLGEESLCDICNDHPRFRNFYSNFTEMGLGLCCEEAAKIVLDAKKPFALVPFEPNSHIPECDETEKDFFRIRNDAVSLIQNRNLSIGARFSALSEMFGFKWDDFSLHDLCDLYVSLERLDEKWGLLLKKLQDFPFDTSYFEHTKLQIPFEQLCCYFIFRHLADALWDDGYSQRIKFCLSGCYIIGALCSLHLHQHGCIGVGDIAEYARMYSAEVEYSDENINLLLENR